MVLLLLSTWVAPVRGDESRDTEARRLYGEGKAAFEQHDWGTAYLRFRDAYMISQRPELLFNMASALKEAGRPTEAADSLRAYLRLVPETPEKRAIEERILALEEAQKILDREHKQKAEQQERERLERERQERARAALATPPPASAGPAAIVAPTPRPVVDPRARRRRLGLAIGIPVGVVVLVGIGLGIGAGLATSNAPAPSESTLGTWRATR